jgi:hypothetical protein
LIIAILYLYKKQANLYIDNTTRKIAPEAETCDENVSMDNADEIQESEEDKIMTILYKTNKGWGRIEPSDDVSELKFFNIKELNDDMIVNEHKILLKIFLEDLKK